MAQYKYRAKKADGKWISGKMEAADKAELQRKLHEQSAFLVSASEIGTPEKAKAWKAETLADFCRQTGIFLQAGVPLFRALAIIADGEHVRPGEKKLYEDILRQLRQGIAFSDALESQGDVFPPLLVHMCRFAESSGDLAAVFLQLAVHYEKMHKLDSRVSSALVYPKLLLVTLAGVLLLLGKVVLPRFGELLSMSGTLSLPIRVLISIGDLMEAHWGEILVALVTVIGGSQLLLQMPAVRYQWHRFLVKAPVFGRLNRIIYTSRFARTLSSLYAAGIPIVNGLQITRKTIGNDYIDAQFDQLIASVRAGNDLSDGLDEMDGFVKKLKDSIQVGEETGRFGEMLSSTADFMEYDADMAISRLTAYIEPAIMLVMGGIIAFVMASVFGAIYDSYGSVSGI